MKCKICSNVEGNRSLKVREMMYGTRDEFAYFQCASCGCLQIAETPADLGKYYPGGYYSFDPLQAGSRGKRLLIGLRNRYALLGRGIAGRMLNKLQPTNMFSTFSPIAITEQSRVLDVGCGSGKLLYAMREGGMRQVAGIDPFIEKDIEYDNGLRIEKKTIDQVLGQWDVIMFNHSFEHMEDQQATLLRVASLLPPGGLCILRVPTVSSHAWDHYGTNWVQLDAPRHLFLHSAKSMDVLARSCNLVPGPVVYDSEAFQFWGSEQYARDIPLRDPRSYAKNPSGSIFKAEKIADFTRRSTELNSTSRGDQAIFHLRKPF